MYVLVASKMWLLIFMNLLKCPLPNSKRCVRSLSDIWVALAEHPTIHLVDDHMLSVATIANSEIRVTDGATLSQQADSESRSEVDQ